MPTHDASPSTAASPSPSPAPSPRRLETQGRLFDAALAVFSELGLQGASVEAICARAGFSRGAFYSNFSSKEQLFLALLEREFEQRANHLATQADMIEPSLRACSGSLSAAQAAEFISAFFGPIDEATGWFILETEFLLLAMREPSLAPGHQKFLEEFYRGIAGAVERVLEAAGRCFSLPAERAMPVLSGVYERALRASALGGPDAQAAIDQLGDHMAELLFAITEPITPPALNLSSEA